MSPEQILLAITRLSPLLFVKVFALILLLLYVIFAAICFRQVDLMNRVVEAQINPVLRLVALIHLGAAIFTLILALFLL